MPNYKNGEIVFEFGGSQNQQFFLRCFDATVRGRWSKANEVGTPNERVNVGALPEIPGIRVRLDGKARRMSTEDPLGFPENANVLRTCNAVLQNTKIFNGKEGVPWEPMVKDGLTATEIKTYLWELANYAWDGKAKVVHGELPSREEILAMDGQLVLRKGITQSLQQNGEPYPPYATDEELERLGAKPKKQPAHAG